MNISFLNSLREREIQDIIELYGDLFRGKRVLEIGGGTGVQAEFLASLAGEVVSLEIAESNYRESANHRVALYDGHHIPFPDASFDVVYSSNVLEHIAHRDSFQEELARVLKPGGHAIHSMPTHWWKLRDMLENFIIFPVRAALLFYKALGGQSRFRRYNGLLDFLVGDRHGEFGNTVMEVYHFMPHVWVKHFLRLKWQVIKAHGGGLFYTGRLRFGQNLPWSVRRLLARLLGSSIHIFLLQKSSYHDSGIKTL